LPVFIFVKKEAMAIIIHYEDGRSEALKPKKVETPAKRIVIIGGGTVSGIPRERAELLVKAEKISADRQKLDEIQVKMGEMFRHKQRIANHLVDVHETSDNDRRKAMCDEMRALRKGYNALYEKKEHFLQHGTWPAEKGDEKQKLTELEKHELFRRRANVAANVSKAKKMVIKHQHNPAKLVQYQEKQASLEAEIREIDELLGK
jgi:predicted MPP superfamily phosphohydrolase